MIVTPTLGGLQLWADVVWRNEYRVQQRALGAPTHFRLTNPQNLRLISGRYDECVARLNQEVPPLDPDHLVVVLHGLGRTRAAMGSVTKRLGERGFLAANIGYPSTRRSIDRHAEQVRGVIEELAPKRVSFVTHSLGGIVARAVLAEPSWQETTTPHRLVSFAPPSTGSAFARALRDTSTFRLVLGQSGQQLAGDLAIPEPTIPTLIIAGSQRGGRGLNPLLDGDDDGVVSVAETRLATEHEHLIVESVHSFVMNEPVAVRRALAFLEG